MVKAEPDDDPPPKIPKAILARIQKEYALMNKARKKLKLQPLSVPSTWNELHDSVIYAQGMLIPLDPQMCAADFLHLNNCIVKYLFEHLIWLYVGKFRNGEDGTKRFFAVAQGRKVAVARCPPLSTGCPRVVHAQFSRQIG